MAVLNKSNRLNKKRRESVLLKNRKCSILSKIKKSNMLSNPENTIKKPNSIISVLKKLEKTNPDFLELQREIGIKAKEREEAQIFKKYGKDKGLQELKELKTLRKDLNQNIIEDFNL